MRKSSSTEPGTLVELLRWRASERGGETLYTYLVDGDGGAISITYGELDRRARAIAASLQGVARSGDRALLVYPSGLEYVAAFFGCLYAGVIAVPVYPPRRGRLASQLGAIAQDARPRAALTTQALRSRLDELRPGGGGDLDPIRIVATDALDLGPGAEGEWREPPIGPDTLAFLQYTSGSTQAPRGVMVSHGNLLRNERLIALAFRHDETSVGVGWLPLYHDMGLIGNILQPLYAGFPFVLLSTSDFVTRPQRWLEAISRYGGTTSGGPNFAYDLCVRRFQPGHVEGLDLGTWRVAFCGAEPVRADTLERFAEAYAPAGFRREAFLPCYGLAESTLIVSGGARERPPDSEARAARPPPVVEAFEAASLERHRAVRCDPARPGARRLVGCGRPLEAVAIVDPTSPSAVPEGVVGEIWVTGPSVAQGYWDRPAETEQAFGATLGGGPQRFLRTGDLGFLLEGELFVSGRSKDLIIVRGRNLYPQDIELTVERSHPALRPGCGAALAMDRDGEEHLAIVHEIEGRAGVEPGAVADAIRRAVAAEHEEAPGAIVLVAPRAVPKTSSGKVQRAACRGLLLAGELDVVWRWDGAPDTPDDAPEDEGGGAELDETQQVIARIWAEALGVARVGPRDDFFERGGDSLRAGQVLDRVNDAFSVSISLAAAMDAFTVERLAELVEMDLTRQVEQLSSSRVRELLAGRGAGG